MWRIHCTAIFDSDALNHKFSVAVLTRHPATPSTSATNVVHSPSDCVDPLNPPTHTVENAVPPRDRATLRNHTRGMHTTSRGALIVATTAVVALGYTLMAIAYLAYAFDASNRNGTGLTIALAVVLFALPALFFGSFAWRMWRHNRP